MGFCVASCSLPSWWRGKKLAKILPQPGSSLFSPVCTHDRECLMRLLRAVLIGWCTLSLAAPAAANLIVNGSFETPLVPVGSFTNYPGGSTAITGWTVVGVDSAVTSGTFTQSGITFQAQDGAQWIDMAGVTSNAPSSGVTQTFQTTPGVVYEVAFYVGSARDGRFFDAATVDLSINGGPRVSYFNPATPSTMLDWAPFSTTFVAIGASSTITFQNGSAANNFLGALDNVSVVAIPEPESLILLTWAVVEATLRRTRR